MTFSDENPTDRHSHDFTTMRVDEYFFSQFIRIFPAALTLLGPVVENF